MMIALNKVYLATIRLLHELLFDIWPFHDRNIYCFDGLVRVFVYDDISQRCNKKRSDVQAHDSEQSTK